VTGEPRNYPHKHRWSSGGGHTAGGGGKAAGELTSSRERQPRFKILDDTFEPGRNSYMDDADNVLAVAAAVAESRIKGS
jgi:hypothetical protein